MRKSVSEGKATNQRDAFHQAPLCQVQAGVRQVGQQLHQSCRGGWHCRQCPFTLCIYKHAFSRTEEGVLML